MNSKPKVGPLTLAYRVVYMNDAKKLVSPLISLHGGVEFAVNKTTKPNKGCGPLCCFSSYEAAEAFVNQHVSTCRAFIYQAVIKPSKQVHVWTSSSHRTPLRTLSEGKVLADSVTLVGEPVFNGPKVAEAERKAQLKASRELVARLRAARRRQLLRAKQLRAKRRAARLAAATPKIR